MTKAQIGSRKGSSPIRKDVVRVRRREEILATLEGDGSLEALPFMPEMLDYCGEELEVYARADKTCDTIEETGTTRRMRNTVHLAGARCDGSAHGGCQAGCLLFWREEWLEWPDAPGHPIVPAPVSAGASVTADVLEAATQVGDNGEGPVYRCQATELLRASTPLRMREMGQYVTDVRTRNARFWVVVRGLLIEAFNLFQKHTTARLPRWMWILGGQRYPFVKGTATGEPRPGVGLRPGELVEVRSKAEIMATLGPDLRNRRMLFDAEMLPYCRRRARVERVVERIVDEKTGRMIKLRDCVVLENVVCTGAYHRFCQRAITPYWREAWLRPVAVPGDHKPGA